MKSKVLKFLPVAALVILTLSLMIYFKENRESLNEVIEDGHTALAGFYSENLKPLFTRSTLDNEDVFNFAVYNHLPVDKEQNTMMNVAQNNSDNEFIELKEAEFPENTANYDTFVKYLDLQRNEKEKLDSILESYKDILNRYILINDDNVVAVNSKINLLNQSLRADLIGFAEKNSKRKSEELFSRYDFQEISPLVDKMRKLVDDNEEGDFVVFTGDSIFNLKINISNLINNALNDDSVFNIKSDNIDNDVVKILPRTFADAVVEKTFIEQNKKVAQIKCPKIPAVDEKEVKWIKSEMMTASKEMRKLKFKLNKLAKENDYSYDINSDMMIDGDDTSFVFSLKYDLPDVADFYNESDIKDWEQFGLAMDSLSSGFDLMLNDSTFRLNAKGIKINIKSREK